MKKYIILLFTAVMLLGYGPLLAEEKDDSLFSEIPEWVKRVSYGISWESDQKPNAYLETVQPLHQSFDQRHTFFTHDRISVQEGRGKYSAGLGYRRLMMEDRLLGGINTFFDYQDDNKHYRTGLGLEAITRILEARLNTYFGLSPKRIVEQSATSTLYEKAVDGYDLELGGPVPFLPWLKLFGGYYYYDYKQFKDMEGGKVRAEIKPFKFITFNLEAFDDNKGDREYRLDTRFNLAFEDLTLRSILEAFKPSSEPIAEVSLKDRALDRVERNFNIQVESWKESGNSVIEIKRGN